MKENVTLLQEINDLRKEVHTLKQKLKGLGSAENYLGATARSKLEMSMRSKGGDQTMNDVQKELKLQDIQVKNKLTIYDHYLFRLMISPSKFKKLKSKTK